MDIEKIKVGYRRKVFRTKTKLEMIESKYQLESIWPKDARKLCGLCKSLFRGTCCPNCTKALNLKRKAQNNRKI